MSSKFVALAAVALIGVGSVASARADVLFDSVTGQSRYRGDPMISMNTS